MTAATRFSSGRAEIPSHENRADREEVALSFRNEVETGSIFASRRFVGGLRIQFRESRRRATLPAHLRLESARIENFDFDREPCQLSLPVALLHDATDVHLVARPINAALGKNEGLELIGRNISTPSVSKREKSSSRSERE